MARRNPVALTWLSVPVLIVGLLAGCRSSGHGCRPCSGPGGGSAPLPTAVLPPGPASSPPAPFAPETSPRTVAPYGGQKTCPVMGEPLEAMGAPIPVSVAGETVYVCCKGCVRRVQADPDKYLAIARAERTAR